MRLFIVLATILFCSCNRHIIKAGSTDPYIIADFSDTTQIIMFDMSVKAWGDNIVVDTLDFIDAKQKIIPKERRRYSYKNSKQIFIVLKIDSIDSHLVIGRQRIFHDIGEELSCMRTYEEKYGKLYGYIVNRYPTFVHGNSAHLFFKKISKITTSPPYTPVLVDNTYIVDAPKQNGFNIVENGKLKFIDTGDQRVRCWNETEYFEIIKEFLPKQ